MPGAFGTASVDDLRAAATAETGTDGVDLVAQVTTPAAYSVGDADAPRHIVAYDYGLKHSILRGLSGLGRITVVAAHP